MKFFFTIFTFSLLLLSCNKNSCTINGTVTDENLNGKALYLSDFYTNQKLDTTLVVDGKFTFTGSYNLLTRLRIDDENNNYYANILSENEDITVKLADKSIVSSNGINGELNKINQQINDIYLKWSTIRDSLSKIEKTKYEIYNLMSERYIPIANSVKEIYLSSLSANKENSLGVHSTFEVLNSRNISLMEVDSILNKLPLIKDIELIKSQYKVLKSIDETSSGKQFKDFPAKNVDGTPTKLSNYVGKGKYVLVDFWASWCGPCTAELPNLRYLHETYPELIVLGVNVWDKEDQFHKFINDKNEKWTMLYASDNNTAMNLYGITGIPKIILFNPQGIIVDRDLRGEGMKVKIAEIFKSK